MSVVSLLGVKVLNNPAAFGDAYQFEITFECLENLARGRSTASARSNPRLIEAFRPRMEAHLCWICYIVSYKRFPFSSMTC